MFRLRDGILLLRRSVRPSRIITSEEISVVIATYKEYPSNAVVLESILDNRYTSAYVVDEFGYVQAVITSIGFALFAMLSRERVLRVSLKYQYLTWLGS
jgi:hypothetical protein